MNIDLWRKYCNESYTIGKLYIDGTPFCDTLEDKVREIAADGSGKVYGMTAIPYGEYRVVVTYSPRFKRRMPLLQGVPHFDGIRIHAGNTAADTMGCILVGRNEVKGIVLKSRQTEADLTSIIDAAIKRGEDIYITIHR